MAEYSIGEAERLTGLPAHTLRYWEENIPFIRPRKDDRGRRIYSSRDVELFLRIKELVQEKKFTLEGAGDQLVRELTGSNEVGSEGSCAGIEPGDPACGAPVGTGTGSLPGEPAGVIEQGCPQTERLTGSEAARLEAARKIIAEVRADLLALYDVVHGRSVRQ